MWWKSAEPWRWALSAEYVCLQHDYKTWTVILISTQVYLWYQGPMTIFAHSAKVTRNRVEAFYPLSQFFFFPHRVPVSHAWDYKVKWHSTCESHKKHVPHKDMLIYGHVSTETESWWSHRTDNNRFKRFRLKIKHQHLFLLKPKNVFSSCRVCVFGCVTIADSLSQHY